MFMHQWAITAGLSALAAPFIVHWLTKPRPARLPLSTIKFVQEIVKQRKARNRLRDWVILLLRAAAIALFAFVLARPLSGNRAAGTPQGDEKTVRVVLLDVSQSMAAVSNGVQSLERGRAIAIKQIDHRDSMLSNLILCAATPHSVLDRPSTNAMALIDEASQAVPLPQRLQAQSALNTAAEMLSRAGGDKVRRELIVISDFQRSNWVAADFSVLPTDTIIDLQSVAPDQTPGNVAIVRVGPQGRVERDRPFRLEVEVGNYSPSPRQMIVEVTIADRQFRLQGNCPAGATSTLVAEATLPVAGWLNGEARLIGVDDALENDNRRSIALQVHPRPRYVMLTRQSATARAGSSYFLERAISPVASASKGEQLVRMDPDKADRTALAEADVLLLDHPGKLSPAIIESLSGLMLRGRGVLYVTSEPVDATNLKLLTQASGTSLQLPVEFVPSSNGQSRKNLFLSDFKPRQSPFSVFGEESSAILAPIRFGGGLATRRVEGALMDDVVATYNDQSASIVVTACGAGSLSIMNMDLGASNLPSSPAFVPIIGELVSHLLGRDRPQEPTYCGEPIAVFLPPSAVPVAGLQIEPAAGVTHEEGSLGELHEESVGVMWQAASAGPPGVYSIRRGRDTIYALATTLSPEESDLMTLTSELITGRLAGGRDVSYRSIADKPAEQGDSLWATLAVICLICICLEMFGLKLFRC